MNKSFSCLSLVLDWSKKLYPPPYGGESLFSLNSKSCVLTLLLDYTYSQQEVATHMHGRPVLKL